MYEPNQENTSFITDRGVYYNIGMPIGLINVWTTYRRQIILMFKDHIRNILEVYVDDMLVISKIAPEHVCHLYEKFDILRSYEMKFNPQKCVYGVKSGKFLGVHCEIHRYRS